MNATSGYPLYVPHVPAEQYLLFRQGLPLDRRLPAQYTDWQLATDAHIAALKANGAEVQIVPIDWDMFVAYAHKMDMRTSFGLLTVYAIKKGRENQSRKQAGETS